MKTTESIINIEKSNLDVELIWNDLNLETNENKTLLKSVSGKIKSGMMIALMGSSGAGKTTLMNSLTGRLPSNIKLHGSILLNGKPRNPKTWNTISSYVSQVFYAYEYQTVKETLEFVYNIKLNKKNCNDDINELLSILGLSKATNNYVSKLSGGERIRLSIGIELIGNPSILFLDEPFSGLDSFNVIHILKFLRNLANTGKAIIITIHQPSYQVLTYFDSIYLMSQGGVIFNGSCNDCIEHFNNLGFILPQNTNPAEFFLDIISINFQTKESMETSLLQINKLKQIWTDKKIQYNSTITTPIQFNDKKVYNAKLLKIIKIYKRNIQDIIRNKTFILIKIFQRLLTAILFSIVYWMVGKNKLVSVLSFRGIFTFLCLNSLFGICNPIFNIFKQEQNIILRESRSGFYTGYSMYLAKFLSELTFLSLIEIPYLTIVYILTGFGDTIHKYLLFISILMTEIIFGITFGMTISIISPSANIAQNIGSTIIILFILFSGSFNQPNDLSKYLRWLIWFSPVQYTFRSVIQTQSNGKFFSMNSQNTDDTLTNIDSNTLVQLFGLSNIQFNTCFCIILIFSLITGSIGSYILHKQTKNTFIKN